MINLKGQCQPQILISLSNSPEKVIPGGHFTLFFDVKSFNNLPESLEENLILPEKWNMLSQRKPERIPGQKSLRYFFVIGTPANCSSGDYSVKFKLSSNATELAQITTSITIQSVRKIEIFVVSQPEFVKEGDILHMEYFVQNSGNSKEVLTMKTSRGSIEDFKDSLVLIPNSRIKVIVSQEIPYTESNAWQISTDLYVHVKEIPEPFYHIVSIPVFSSKVRKIDPYFRFPVEIGAGYLSYKQGKRQMAALQYSLTGSGFLDQKNKHHADFIIRGPNQYAFPAIGSYDQYSFNYRYKKKTFVTLGDYMLQLNNLMEFGRFGRGAMIEQEFGKTGYSAFYQKPRFYSNQKESFGGKFSFKFNNSSNINLSYTSKNVIFHRERFWSNLLGISTFIRTKAVTIESEFATGKAKGKIDYGLFAKFELSKNWINFSGNLIYAGKKFYGFYNNSFLLNGNVSFHVTRKFNVGLSINLSKLNPSLDINVYNTSPKASNYMTFASYLPNPKTNIFVFYSIQKREDRQKISEFHYSENFGNLSYNYNNEKFSISYQVRYGKSRNLLLSDTTGKKESYSNVVQPGIRFRPGFWIGAYLEHQHTSKFSKENITQDLFFYGGNMKFNLKKRVFASFMYRNNYAPDELYMQRSFLDVSLSADLKRHIFTLTGGRSFIPNMPGSNQNTLFFSFKYVLKLGIALAKKRNVGRVTGKLTGEGFSKKGNLIQLGSHKFLTDTSGIFSFDGLPTDTYYLSIIPNKSENDGVVSKLKMPLYINVQADSLKHIEIPLTRTGGVKGKIEFVKVNQNGLSTIMGQLPTILIKLSNEMESFLTELNEKNEFSFKEMKPGDWTLSALIPGDEDRYVIDDSQKQFQIEVDKLTDVVFKVRPNEKRIHFSGKSFDLSIKK